MKYSVFHVNFNMTVFDRYKPNLHGCILNMYIFLIITLWGIICISQKRKLRIESQVFFPESCNSAPLTFQPPFSHNIKLIGKHYNTDSIKIPFILLLGFPGGSEVKASASNAGDPGAIPGSGRSPGEGNGNPLEYSCLEKPSPQGCKELDMTE